MTEQGFFSRFFLPLFITQFLGALNDNILKNAMIVYAVFALGENGAIYAAAAPGFFILPFVLFSGLAGHLSDRFDKAIVMRGVKAAEVAIVLLGSFGFFFQNPPLLLCIIFLMGAHAAFFSPAK